MAGPAEGRPQGALAQAQCSTHIQERQEEACYARGYSSPQLEDSLPHHVDTQYVLRFLDNWGVVLPGNPCTL